MNNHKIHVVLFVVGLVLLYNLNEFAISDDNSTTRLQFHDFYQGETVNAIL